MDKRKLFLTAAIALSTSSLAYAYGVRSDREVTIVGNVVEGSLGSARNLTLGGTVGYTAKIGCKITGGIYINPTTGDMAPTDPLVYCYGHEPTSATIADTFCTSSSPSVATAVAAMNGDSMVKFEVIPNGQPYAGQCLSVTVENGSAYAPKMLP